MSKLKIYEQLIADINADASLKDWRAKARAIHGIAASDPVYGFFARLPQDAKDARGMVDEAFGVFDAVKGKVAEIRADVDLTAEAKARKMKEAATGKLDQLKTLYGRITEMSTATANLRKALAPPAPDRSDIFGELQRQEDRRMVLEIPNQAKRLAAVMADSRLMQAVLLGHPLRSGLTDRQLDEVRQAYVEREHGPRLRGIEQREKIVAEVTAAVAVATGMLRRETGLTESEIDAGLKEAA